MIRELLHSRALQSATAVLLLSLLLAGWAFGRAVSVTPVAEAASPVFATSAATAKLAPRTPFSVAGVVADNVFAPERTPPARRYRISGYVEEAPREQLPQPLVLGTSVAGQETSFAICRVAAGPATIVRIGDKIGGYTVVTIERGLVVFTAPTGERVAVKAASP